MVDPLFSHLTSGITFPTDWNSPLFKHEPDCIRFVWMNPKIFLFLTPPWKFNRIIVEEIKNTILHGKPIEPLFLDIDVDTCRVIGHEGRHRALAADELNIEYVPVILFYKKHGYYYRLKDDENPCIRYIHDYFADTSGLKRQHWG